MKKLVILCGVECGYCKKAKMLLNRALEKQPKYLDVNIRYLLDESEEGQRYVHTLVPALYCDDILFFEGNPNMDIIKSALENCLNG